MSASIFLIGRNDELTELQQTNYEFRGSAATAAGVLSLDPRRQRPAGTKLLLIRREFGVPEEARGSDRWSIDHLFVDQAGVPVLVEVNGPTTPAFAAKLSRRC